MEVLLPSTRPPGGAPTTAPDRSGAKPKRTFRPQPAPKSRPKPVRSAALRREEGGSTGRQVFAKEAWPPIPTACRACPRERRPAPDDWRPLREAIARGLSLTTSATFALAKPLGWTEVQPREPRGSTARRFRVPSLI
jgi:hypothetical protein